MDVKEGKEEGGKEGRKEGRAHGRQGRKEGRKGRRNEGLMNATEEGKEKRMNRFKDL
jgi:hypothetical protein